MTIHYTTVYRKDTGQIVSTGYFSCEDEMVDINFAIRADQYGGRDHDVIDAQSDTAIHYVIVMGDRTIIAERPHIPYQVDKTTLTAGTGDYITITGLHNPCELVIDDPDPT